MRIASKAGRLFLIYALILLAVVGAGFFSEAVGLGAAITWGVIGSSLIGAVAWRWIKPANG
jgi:hypothetical protein